MNGNRLLLFESIAFNEKQIYAQKNGEFIIKTIYNELKVPSMDMFEGTITKKLDFSHSYHETDKEQTVKLMAGDMSDIFVIQLQNGSLYEKEAGYPLLGILNGSIRNFDVIDIQCGDKHSLFLTANGNVFSMGLNYKGQCGHCDNTQAYNTDYIQPTLISEFTTNGCFMKSISCAPYNSCCIDKKTDKLWYFGGLIKGHPLWPWAQGPEIILNEINVKKAKCGSRGIVALSTEGYGYLFDGTSHCLPQNYRFTDFDVFGENIMFIGTDNHLYSINFQSDTYIPNPVNFPVDSMVYKVICGNKNTIIMTL
eukprot:378907_1